MVKLIYSLFFTTGTQDACPGYRFIAVMTVTERLPVALVPKTENGVYLYVLCVNNKLKCHFLEAVLSRENVTFG